MPLVSMHIFCVPLGKPSKISTKPLKKAYFATCLAFWPDFVLKTNKTVRKSRQVEEKPTFFLFIRPTPGQRRRCDGPPPGHTPGYARALVARGAGHPGKRPREMWPDPGVSWRCPGSAPPPPAALGPLLCTPHAFCGVHNGPRTGGGGVNAVNVTALL